MLIQYALIVAVVLLLVYFLRNHGSSRTAAGVKIGFALFLLLAVVAVASPVLLSDAATLLGVGRGTDLLLYALVVAFTFVVINFYLRSRELDEKTTRLARAVALREAESANRDRGLIPEARPVTNTNDHLTHGPEATVTQ
jgi:hypothetical protein